MAAILDMTLTPYALEISPDYCRMYLSDIQSYSILHAVTFDTKHAMYHWYFPDYSIFDSFYGGHLGNDVIKKKANVIGFQNWSKCVARTLYKWKKPRMDLENFFSLNLGWALLWNRNMWLTQDSIFPFLHVYDRSGQELSCISIWLIIG